MDNQELLTQVTDLFKQHNEVISERFDKLDNRIDHLENEVKKVRLDIEVNVAKRIETLFDSYKLTHEKQWEQERKIEELYTVIEIMQMRLAALEEKSA